MPPLANEMVARETRHHRNVGLTRRQREITLGKAARSSNVRWPRACLEERAGPINPAGRPLSRLALRPSARYRPADAAKIGPSEPARSARPRLPPGSSE